jgi:cell division protein FtsB
MQLGLVSFVLLRTLSLSGMIALDMAQEQAQPRRMARVWLMVIAVLGIIVIGDLNRRMTDSRRLEQDSGLLQTEVAWLEGENDRLATQIAEATTAAYIENWAHSQGKMVRPGERLIVPVPASGYVPTPTPSSTTSGQTPFKWQVWWALLFGSEP